ncbi:MAG: hypothetical protein ACR2FO_00835 [Actinomycetota bacterium]
MRKKGLTLVAAVFSTLAIGSFAWACTAQPQVFLLMPQAGPSGVEVTVSGQMTTTGPVEIRWSGNGISEGLKLADSFVGPGASFSVPVQIPESKPGVYYITVEAGDRSMARASFEVTGETAVSTASSSGTTGSAAQSRAVSTDLWRGFSAESGSSPQAGGDLSVSDAPLNGGVAMGLGLSAIGAIALGGLATVALQRRRIEAGTLNGKLRD